MKALAVVLLSLVLCGCAAIQPPQPPIEPVPLALQPSVAGAKGRAGGVFATERGWTLTSDSRAFRPGDVLTVVLSETTQASKRADTRIGKESNASISAASKTTGIDANAGVQRDFNGTASSSQQNTLQGAITVVVHEVLPNGLLRVQGEKSLYLNQGEEMIRLSGYVRGADVDSDNRVSSQRIANARIAYSGQGALADANSPGWLTRFFTSPWMPL
ncbi:flagellar basal body L-ring protein FlgH [Roseateles violae]|uniref:Flagellar L-ring protein n=1 Tax=Roseateles violae TaxID=3058042 RepID=A0ABT8DTC1_9BURK|nr:flagellar basal body L-ring protein FlgH [Pelomonas sp. PFR6]MDN3921551.1 flagellar basal body L-ring protein FlgH [Pelomonas sp. PFR6]